VVTSPQPNDGKSTIAANLAAAIGLSGQPVVLVDGDLRRPTVAESFGLVQGAGLTDVLAGQADVHDLLQRAGGHPNLQVLASGSIPPNPSELMGSKSMRTLLHKLSESAIVIIDAPPLLPVTDAAVLTAITDGAFVVISSGKTLDTELAAALGHLQTVNGRALGIILNRISKRGPDTGYYQSNYYRAEAGKAVDKRRPRARRRPRTSLAPDRPVARQTPNKGGDDCWSAGLGSAA
jgi:capsular exopolysaccharide synthesis family protein